MKEKILNLIKEGKNSFKVIHKTLKKQKDLPPRELDRLLKELWKEEKIYFRKKTQTYHLKDKDVEFVGTFKETKKDFGFVDLDKGQSIFIPGRFTLNALEGDKVKVKAFPVREGEDPNRVAGKVVRIIERNTNRIIGRINEDNIFVPDDRQEKYKYEILSKENFKPGDVLSTKFNEFKHGTIFLDNVEYIGRAEDPQIDYLIIGLKNNLKTEFEDKVINAVENKTEAKGERRDITKRMIVTIDGESSKDLDDAIDVERLEDGGLRLGVHIADVSHYVEKDSIIDNEAKERGTSVYLIDKVFPMLPEALSNDLCSLNPDTEKLAMSVDMYFDKNYHIKKVDIFRSKIISKYRLTYSEVDKFFKSKELLRDNKELSVMINDAYMLSLALREQKIKAGMIDFSLPETKISLDSNGFPTKIDIKYQTPSEKMIEDLMVITNEVVAKELDSNGFPGIYRVHDKPKEENLIEFINLGKVFGEEINKSVEKIKSKDLMDFVTSVEGKDYEMILKRFLIQTMEKAVYSNSNEGHYALGLKNYLHFTSPIRRYPDLIVHRLVKKYIIDKASKEDVEEESKSIEYLAKSTSDKERNAMASERKLMDIKKSRFMSDQIGNKTTGRIVSIQKFGMFVELDNLVHGLIRIETLGDEEYFQDEEKYQLVSKDKKKVYKIGQKIGVKILGVDTIRGLVDLGI